MAKHHSRGGNKNHLSSQSSGRWESQNKGPVVSVLVRAPFLSGRRLPSHLSQQGRGGGEEGERAGNTEPGAGAGGGDGGGESRMS